MPADEKVMNRWLVVGGGILIQLCLGAIYAWSAFTKKLTDPETFNFTKEETQWIFAVGLASFAFFMALIAGKWQAKVGPRIVAITGGLIMGAGYVIASFAPNTHDAFWQILIGVGLLGGAGIGFAYVCPLAALVKWFPDKKGLITGLAVAGFGFGALIWVKLTDGFTFGPVKLTGDASISSGVPWKTIRPPRSPAPGPISTTWSAARRIASSCSTTTTVLPRSRRRPIAPTSRSTSCGCRPIDGSSRT